MAMTIEQVRREIADMVDDYLAHKWIAALDAHIAQPAQAVDVVAMAAAAFIEHEHHKGCRPTTHQIREHLTRALAGEKAGWRGLTEDERAKIVSQICDYGTGFVTPLFIVIENAEKMLRERNLPASPTPDKEG